MGVEGTKKWEEYYVMGTLMILYSQEDREVGSQGPFPESVEIEEKVREMQGMRKIYVSGAPKKSTC